MMNDGHNGQFEHR